jgi:hypothetical protein
MPTPIAAAVTSAVAAAVTSSITAVAGESAAATPEVPATPTVPASAATRMGECETRGPDGEERQTCCGEPVHMLVTHDDTSKMRIQLERQRFNV